MKVFSSIVAAMNNIASMSRLSRRPRLARALRVLGLIGMVVVVGCRRPSSGGAVSPSAPSQGPRSNGLAVRVGESPLKPYEQWRVERADAPALDVFVARKDRQRRPLVVFIQGSHCLPLFMLADRDGERRELSTFLLHSVLSKELQRAHFAAVERRGLKSFGAPPASEEEARAAAPCTQQRGGVSKVERVKNVADVVTALASQPWVDGVFVVGHSEGAYVASGVVHHLRDVGVSGVALLSGPGPTQFFDFVLEARHQNDQAAVKRVFDEMIWVTGPDAKGDYRGADVARQVTYSVDSTSIDDLRGSKVPIFVAGGTRDDKAQIEGADVFVAEMLRDRERTLRYVILSGLDHGYIDADGKDHSGEVLTALLDWALAPDKDRSVVVGLEPAAKR
jgi:pimeloyl-ACP methyl ester carboxylesterase